MAALEGEEKVTSPTRGVSPGVSCSDSATAGQEEEDWEQQDPLLIFQRHTLGLLHKHMGGIQK